MTEFAKFVNDLKEAQKNLPDVPTVEYEYTFNNYQTDAALTLDVDANPLLLALGIGGEAGEVLEVIKKGNRPGKTLDVSHLKEELGDLMWYIANVATTYDLDLEEIVIENIDKLKKRYGR